MQVTLTRCEKCGLDERGYRNARQRQESISISLVKRIFAPGMDLLAGQSHLQGVAGELTGL
jgi:hypothetical protein